MGGVERRSVAELRADLLGVQRRLLKTHDGFVRLRVLRRVFTLVSRPDVAHRILVSGAPAYRRGFQHRNLGLTIGKGLLVSDGDVWERQRRLTRPVFERAVLGRVVDIAAEATGALVDRWLEQSSGPVDVLDEMRRLSLRVISLAVFGAELPEQAGMFIETARVSLAVASRRNILPLSLPLWAPTRLHRRRRRCLAEVDRFVYARIDERLAGDGHDDILTRLIRGYGDQAQASRREIRDQVVTLYFAGFETTAAALTLTWLMLGEHPRVADRLRTELVATLGHRHPTYPQLSLLTYTRNTLKESMRLRPPVYTVPRTATADERIGDAHVRRGDDIVVATHVLHSCPTIWEAPQHCRPDRFEPGRLTVEQRRAYLPFGAGPRRCIGESFAMATMMTVLAVVARRVRLRPRDGRPVVPATEVTQFPANGLPMLVDPLVPDAAR
ncbi:cytochrome P450 [Actinoplanes sichuanensis]|uniref:Cytochrome P450 n=1 Tax=Actinoplanes sichuanensis TaxID=512349 RepID=A0ABW4A3C2_9ACTN|nr:cytochrome P450 [Actinoplanes sichuanensis]BEL05826.1 cytochrome P450 [Actinoplanes sichuanensis]